VGALPGKLAVVYETREAENAVRAWANTFGKAASLPDVLADPTACFGQIFFQEQSDSIHVEYAPEFLRGQRMGLMQRTPLMRRSSPRYGPGS